MIHNADAFVRAPFLELSEAEFEASLGVGLRGPLFLSQAAAKVMLRQESGGQIIALIGNSLYESWPDYVSHSVGKATLARLIEILSVALSPAVQCLTVAPNQVVWTSEDHDQGPAESSGWRRPLTGPVIPVNGVLKRFAAVS